MPQHRAIATVVNTALIGAGVTGEIVVAEDNEDPRSFHLFNKQLAGLSAAMIIFALFGELITLGAHEDREEPPPKPLDCATVLAAPSRTSNPEQARRRLDPTIVGWCERKSSASTTAGANWRR